MNSKIINEQLKELEKRLTKPEEISDLHTVDEESDDETQAKVTS